MTPTYPQSAYVSDRKRLICLLLLLLIPIGIHRFYVGKIGTGLLFLLTGGGFGIWYLIDLIMIVVGSFADSNGRRVEEWT